MFNECFRLILLSSHLLIFLLLPVKNFPRLYIHFPHVAIVSVESAAAFHLKYFMTSSVDFSASNPNAVGPSIFYLKGDFSKHTCGHAMDSSGLKCFNGFPLLEE